MTAATRPPHHHSTVPLVSRLIAEFLGTFLLVLAGAGAIVVASEQPESLSHEGIAATFGLVIMVLIYAFGHISGAHFNPAVTLAFAIAHHFDEKEVLSYWAVQFLAAITGAAMLRLLFGNEAHLRATLPSGSDGQSFVLEVMLSFFLMLVIMSVAADTRPSARPPPSLSAPRSVWSFSPARFPVL